MLSHLTIKNYALINHLEMNLSRHLNVITGETGAGKSIMLGALGLLLGNRADTKVLWNPKEKCITEGVFDIKTHQLKSFFEAENLDYEDQTVLRREISATGKSRAFVNDTPVTLDVMKRIGSTLMDIHSQHKTLNLANRQFQLKLIDSYASNSSEREQYRVAWEAFKTAKKKYSSLQDESQILREEADFVNFQLDELQKADLQEGEQTPLEEVLKVMEHAEDIKLKFNTILSQLDQSEVSVSVQLNTLQRTLNSISHYSENYKSLLGRFESLRIELDDIVDEIGKENQKIDFDPQKIERTSERLSLIYQLQQKHSVTQVAGLLEIQQKLQSKADKTVNLDHTLSLAKRDLESAANTLEEYAKILTKSRIKVFSSLSHEITSLLKDLGMPEPKLKMNYEKTAFDPTGADHIEFLFSAGKGILARPIGQVASGGEFSRLMFCVKYVLAEKMSLPTLILDEIDTGVSGEIAIRLGRMMKVMAAGHQLIAISHLPQIAAKADYHFFAYKDSKTSKTISRIRQLSENERVDEIAKMIAGEKPSAPAIENAKELINN